MGYLLKGVPDVRVGVLFKRIEVFADISIEENRILRNDRHLRSQRIQIYIRDNEEVEGGWGMSQWRTDGADVNAIDLNGTLCDWNQSEQRQSHRRLQSNRR